MNIYFSFYWFAGQPPFLIYLIEDLKEMVIVSVFELPNTRPSIFVNGIKDKRTVAGRGEGQVGAAPPGAKYCYRIAASTWCRAGVGRNIHFSPQGERMPRHATDMLQT